MSYSKYLSDRNSIYVCKGPIRDFDGLEPDFENHDYKVLKNPKTQEFDGMEIKNFLSPNELNGMRAEERFKALLESNNIPYLYIGQGPFGIERSGVLIEQSKSKRADFLVNIPNMGTLLFDVKCRSKLPLKASGERYFSLFVSEIDALHNLQKLVMLPVWLAFFDRSKMSRSNASEPFYFIPIIVVRKFMQEMFRHFQNEKELHDIKVLRIPIELFEVINQKMSFEVGLVSISKTLAATFAKKHIGYIRKLKDKIKNTIREQPILKSHIAAHIANTNEDIGYYAEINYYVDQMIKEGVIEYDRYRPLRLYGE